VLAYNFASQTTRKIKIREKRELRGNERGKRKNSKETRRKERCPAFDFSRKEK